MAEEDKGNTSPRGNEEPRPISDEAFKQLPGYQNLSEVERLVAVYEYRKEHDLPYYSGGSLGHIRPLPEETMDAFKETDYYNSLNRTEKVIAYGEFRKTITPELAESVDTNVYLTLRNGLSQGVFDGKEAQRAAQYLREHYKDGYDEDMMRNNIKRRALALEGKEITPDVLEERLALQWAGIRGFRDLEYTRECMSAIANDTTLSPEQKKEMQVQELTGYCKRCGAEDNNLKAKKIEHMLDSYPGLKEDVLARLEKQQNPQQTNNTGMSIPLMAKLSSNTR